MQVSVGVWHNKDCLAQRGKELGKHFWQGHTFCTEKQGGRCTTISHLLMANSLPYRIIVFLPCFPLLGKGF